MPLYTGGIIDCLPKRVSKMRVRSTYKPTNRVAAKLLGAPPSPLSALPPPINIRSDLEPNDPRLEEMEPILEDDYPIYGNYYYVVDGEVYMSDWHDITVRELKRRLGAKEIRRCAAVARGLGLF